MSCLVRRCVPEALGRLPVAVGVGCAQNGPTTTARGGWTWAGLLRVRGRGKPSADPTFHIGPSKRGKVRSTETYLRADPTERLAALDAGVAPALRPGSFTAPDKLLAMLREQ